MLLLFPGVDLYIINTVADSKLHTVGVLPKLVETSCDSSSPKPPNPPKLIGTKTEEYLHQRQDKI